MNRTPMAQLAQMDASRDLLAYMLGEGTLPLHSKNVLILEDDPDMIAFYERLLRKKFGVSYIQVATTADEALYALNEVRFDLMISDIKLPNLVSGVDLWHRIRLTVNTPTVFVSSIPVHEYLDLFEKDIPPPPFLHKPFTEKECLTILAGVEQKERGTHLSGDSN